MEKTKLDQIKHCLRFCQYLIDDSLWNEINESDREIALMEITEILYKLEFGEKND